jgi:hypothetical protein
LEYSLHNLFFENLKEKNQNGNILCVVKKPQHSSTEEQVEEEGRGVVKAAPERLHPRDVPRD